MRNTHRAQGGREWRGVFYFENLVDAGNVARSFGEHARVAEYELGYAVQYHKSGPYHGSAAPAGCAGCRWCPE